MQIPAAFTTVTTFSKVSALIIFILFPFVGFYLGYEYHRLSTPTKTEYITQTVIKKEKSMETEADLIKRCGDFPSLPKSSFGSMAIQVKGPMWSPDCRHVAWSNRHFVYGYEGNDENVIKELLKKPTSPKIFEDDGVYVYNFSTKTTEKIYTPSDATDSTMLIGWIGRNKLSIQIADEQHEYSLITGKLTKIKD